MDGVSMDGVSTGSLPTPALEALCAPLAHPTPHFANWAGTFHCSPRALFTPRTEHHCALIVALARRHNRALRPVGIGHSPSDIACCTDYQVRMTALDAVLEVNVAKRYVVAQAGITLAALHAALAPHGLAMRNLGSISDQTLAGIVTTCTHGSGLAFGVMGTHVQRLTLLTAAGSVVHCSPTEHPALFAATLCGLGATGLVLRIQLEVEPAFRLRDVQTVRPFSEVVRDIDAIARSGEHVRLWWFPALGTVRVSVLDRTSDPPNPPASWFWDSLLGFHAVQLLLLAALYLRAANTWAARLAAWLAGGDSVAVDESHRIFNIECRYPQHTTEYALPHARGANTAAALLALERYFCGANSSSSSASASTPNSESNSGAGRGVQFPVEIRFTRADDLWLSPSRGGETAWIGIIAYKPYARPAPYRALFAGFEAVLAAHGGRPHWAKAHHLDARAARRLYGARALRMFLDVLHAVDPRGMFRNEYVQRHLYDEPEPAPRAPAADPPTEKRSSTDTEEGRYSALERVYKLRRRVRALPPQPRGLPALPADRGWDDGVWCGPGAEAGAEWGRLMGDGAGWDALADGGTCDAEGEGEERTLAGQEEEGSTDGDSLTRTLADEKREGCRTPGTHKHTHTQH